MDNVIIIGSGPSGWTAAIYCARANLKPLLFSGTPWGGQLMLTTEVENYPGFPEGVQGPELMAKMRKQAEKFGTRIIDEKVDSVNPVSGGFEVMAANHTYVAKALIISTGADARMLGLPSEAAYVGKGVSTCATCDGFFFRSKDIALVGGGDSAMEEALFLSKVVNSVTIVHRRNELKASRIMQDRAKANPKIKFIWDTVIEEVLGNGKAVTGLALRNLKTHQLSTFACSALFLAIGHVPNTNFLRGIVDLDAHGFIKAHRTRTSVPGIFAAGDVMDPIYKQAVTAAASGCQAALEVERYVEGVKDAR